MCSEEAANVYFTHAHFDHNRNFNYINNFAFPIADPKLQDFNFVPPTFKEFSVGMSLGTIIIPNLLIYELLSAMDSPLQQSTGTLCTCTCISAIIIITATSMHPINMNLKNAFKIIPFQSRHCIHLNYITPEKSPKHSSTINVGTASIHSHWHIVMIIILTSMPLSYHIYYIESLTCTCFIIHMCVCGYVAYM